MNSISFSIENNQKQFKPKEIIKGHLNIIFNSPSQLLQITLKFLGFEKTIQENYEETNIFLKDIKETKFKINKTNNQNAFEKIFNIFSSKENLSKNVSIGLFEHQFKINLPNLLPSSFDCQYGKIKYILIARVLIKNENGKKLWLRNDLNIPIRGQMIQDQLINQKIPLQITGKKKFLFSFKKFFFKFFLDSKIFKTGDLLTGQYHFLNESQRDIIKIHISIRQKFLIFQQQSVYKTEEFIVSKLEFDGSKENSKFSLIIPENLIESIGNKMIQISSVGKIIQIRYRVKIKVDFKFAFPLRISIPIIIIRNNTTNESNMIPSAPVSSNETNQQQKEGTLVDL